MKDVFLFLASYAFVGIAWISICEASGCMWIEAEGHDRWLARVIAMVCWPAFAIIIVLSVATVPRRPRPKPSSDRMAVGE